MPPNQMIFVIPGVADVRYDVQVHTYSDILTESSDNTVVSLSIAELYEYTSLDYITEFKSYT